MASESKKKKGRSKIVFPRREPTIIVQPRPVVYTTADKLTCAVCPCYPKEDPYAKNKALSPCLFNPRTLYEIAAKVVDTLHFPKAFFWSEEEVADWMENEVGLPQYRDCILVNHVNGRRLLRLEDPSHCPELNIHYFCHIKMITAKIHELYGTEFVQFSRSVSLPPLKPLTHTTWFKSRTGPYWGIYQNWTNTDILRWMKIIDPESLHLDHWDLVWYMKPDFPKTLFGRKPQPPFPRVSEIEKIPKYIPADTPEPCVEYMVPRKFRLRKNVPPEQWIWMEHAPGSPRPTQHEWLAAIKAREADRLKKKYIPTVPKPTRLDPPVIDVSGLRGHTLLLARRLLPKKKFMGTNPKIHHHKAKK